MGLNGRTTLIALGAGFNLSTYGIGVWGESVLLTSGTFVGTGASALAELYLLFSALGLFCALAVRVAVAAFMGASNRLYGATGLWAMVLASVLFLSGAWNSSGILVVLAAFCTGWTFACQALFWMSSLSFQPEQMRWAFPLELGFAALLNGVFVAFFMESQALFLGAGIALSTVGSVVLARRDRMLVRPASVPPAGALESRYLPAFRLFVEVLFCVIALQTIAPTLNYMGLLGALSPERQQLAVLVAKAVAAAVLLLVLRRSGASLHSVRLFKFVTPVLILLLFAAPFAEPRHLFVLLVAGSCLHFIVTNSLFCVDAVTIVRQRGLVFEFFYGVGYFVLMVLCSIIEKVMPQLLAASSSADMLLLFGVFFCIYALSMAFVAVRRRRRDGGTTRNDRALAGGDGGRALATFAPDAPEVSAPSTVSSTSDGAASSAIARDFASAALDVADHVRLVQERCGLSDREAEIVSLVMRGKNVPAIAEELVISQNTVRTHMKRIYRACGVHTRQELIALCEGCGIGEKASFND